MKIKKRSLTSILVIGCFLFNLSACFLKQDPIDRYIHHLNKVLLIAEKNSDNLIEATLRIKEYYDDNKSEINQLLSQIDEIGKDLINNPEKTKAILKKIEPVIKRKNDLIDKSSLLSNIPIVNELLDFSLLK